ncbi:restriction endonuclease subunit S [Staphylococcus nepalensis]|jgi:type I restriction enzyme S subunit|uniref:Restriction endonuclease subunit S n=1 Tax=Staphylococcus nepalensis TaxID=214473 RepID=A0A2T4S9N4_9STAP|nr:restriction endonuclease subunit S [Staphylococcus nepalensis]PTK58536.1 restriction endonuclease subunit S [Staphylococcus nepalensis]
MTNEVSNVPELRFPEYREEWEVKKLDEIVDFSKGKHLGKKDLTENDGVPCILYGELYTKYGPIIDEVISKTNIDTNKLKKGTKNQILIPSSGETTEDIATASALNINEDVYIGGDLNILTPKKEDGRFISLSLNGVNKWNVAKFAQGKTVVHLYNNDLRKLHINLPIKIEEQQKIGNFFSKLDRQIELEEQKLEKLEEQKKGYMQQIFSQQLRFKDEDGSNYLDWSIKELKEILTPGNKEKIEDKSIYNRLTVGLHGKGVFHLEQERKTKDTRPFYQRYEGELIIGKQNFFNGSIAIIPKEFNGYICSNAIMSYKFKDNINSKYVLEYLLQNDFLRKNEFLADGTGQKELSEKNFEVLKINIPNSTEEQQKIGDFFKKIDELIETQSSKVELLKGRKQGFLQKMFI